MWAECPATAGRPFPATAKVGSLLQGNPLFCSWQDPANRCVRWWGLDIYKLTGVARPVAGGG